MTGIRIVEANGKKELTQFIDLPWSLYQSYPYWIPIPKLIQKQIFNLKHPFYKTADMAKWMAIKDGKIVGRIAATINHVYNKTHNAKNGFFGFFESINDKLVASTLLKTAERWLVDRGMNLMSGPFNPSINYESALLIEGFNDFPQIMTTYNPPYYAELLESQGLAKAKDFYAYKVSFPFEYPDVIRKIANRSAKKSNVSVRCLDKRRWKHEVDSIRDIYNTSWEKNWGFLPMGNDEFEVMAKDMKSILNEKLVLIVEDKGQPVGFMLTLPDYNQVFKKIPSGHLFPFGLFTLLTGKRYINRVRVMALGVKEEYRKAGLDTLLYIKALDGAREMKILQEAEFSWVLEDNSKMNSIIKRMNSVRYKVYRIYEKALKT